MLEPTGWVPKVCALNAVWCNSAGVTWKLAKGAVSERAGRLIESLGATPPGFAKQDIACSPAFGRWSAPVARVPLLIRDDIKIVTAMYRIGSVHIQDRDMSEQHTTGDLGCT